MPKHEGGRPGSHSSVLLAEYEMGGTEVTIKLGRPAGKTPAGRWTGPDKGHRGTFGQWEPGEGSYIISTESIIFSSDGPFLTQRLKSRVLTNLNCNTLKKLNLN